MKTRIWVILAAVAIITLQVLATIRICRENNRLSDNFKAVLTGMQQDSANAARTERLLLETSEIKEFFPGITESIRKMDVKIRQLERYSSVGTASDYQLAGKLRDTVFVRESIRETVIRDTVKMQYMHYKNEWIDFQQAIVADSAYTSIQTRDSISIVQSWERPHKFWFLKWGRKRHIQSVTNANPHSKVTYSIFIEKN